MINKVFSLSWVAALIVAVSCAPAFALVSATPNAPPTLTVKVSGSDVVLAWTAPTANTNGTTPAKVSGYNVYRSTSPTIKQQTGTGGPAPYVGYSSMLRTAVTFTDVGAAANDYYYAVTAWYCDTGGCGESAVSPIVQATPGNTPVNVTGSAKFSWVAPTTNTDGSVLTNLSGFKVYRGATCDAPSTVATVASSTTTYQDSGLALGTYCYTLTAFNTNGAESAHSPNLIVTFNPPASVPGAPGVPTATCVIVAPAGMTSSCTVSP